MLNVLKLTDQRLLRRAAETGIPFDGPLIDHDGEGETRVVLSLGHDELRSLIHCIVWPIPVDDDAVNAAADHVGNLALDLCGVSGPVSDIHVVRLTEP